ncbi:hypothetical protein M885DRAFT_612852 [Pelagophyceae sp. CCMP2097]|nr:hypothetical protein M885DRAFT_612852 [Pelagophyceae sp. CCMP2097]
MELCVCCLIVEVGPVPGKDTLKEVKLDKGGGATISVITNAPNVTAESVGKRVVVALEGAEVKGITVKRCVVGGRPSEGMFCDSAMLNWKGGGAGTACYLDDNFELGAPAPEERPRPKQAAVQNAVAATADGLLFEKKQTKEEKKAAAAKSKELRKNKKLGIEEVPEPEPVAPPPKPVEAPAPPPRVRGPRVAPPVVVVAPAAPADADADAAEAAPSVAVASLFGKKKKKDTAK